MNNMNIIHTRKKLIKIRTVKDLIFNFIYKKKKVFTSLPF